jgi:hypothetical protein
VNYKPLYTVGMAQTYVRLQSAKLDPAELLDPSTWASRSWGDLQPTKRCPRCIGEDCETCGGSGEIDDVRYGVSACLDLDDLIDYFADRECDYSADYVDGLVVVTFEGQRAEDDDHDEEYGAVLAWPERIVSVDPVPDELRTVVQHEITED